MQRQWIWLNSRPGIGPGSALELLEHFRSLEGLFRAGAEELSKVVRKDTKLYKGLLDKSLFKADEILESCRSLGISVVCYGDPEYPDRLRNIADPPMVLYYIGKLPLLDQYAALSVVGTRQATQYGMKTAYRLGKELAEAGAIVVSGMAGGIDGAAMKGAISAGGATIAVLGSGVDVIYPAENRDLYHAIQENGCVISEFTPGTMPIGRNFPRRNRILSGLSCGVVVVEAPERSGALITAHHALEQGRDVFAVPGELGKPEAAGCLNLLRQGALLAESGGQIMEEYRNLYFKAPKQIRKAALDIPQVPIQQKKVDKTDKKPYDVNHKVMPVLSEDEAAIYHQLSGERIHVDELTAKTQLSASKVLVILTMLELKGLVRQHPGKYYSLP